MCKCFENERDFFLSSQQQLLNSNHSSVSNQIQLEQQKTVKTCADSVQNLPTLPLPFVRPQLTRVIFATSVSQESLKQPLTLDGVLTGRHRAASGSGIRDSNILAEEGETVKHSSMGASIIQHLRSLQHSGDCVIGTSDYDPSRLKVPQEEWVSLERNAASGLRGVAMENFKPSLLVMDHTTDNSNTPFCVVNGKSCSSNSKAWNSVVEWCRHGNMEWCRHGNMEWCRHGNME